MVRQLSIHTFKMAIVIPRRPSRNVFFVVFAFFAGVEPSGASGRGQPEAPQKRYQLETEAKVGYIPAPK